MSKRGTALWRPLAASLRWLSSDRSDGGTGGGGTQRIEWLRCLPFLAMHAGCLLVLTVGISPAAIAVAGVLYVARMFAITGFYHRYFAHRSFATSRAFQFAMALAGASAGQRGPLWWAAHHRRHHQLADSPVDLHSPRHRGFWHSHVGWFMTAEGFATDWRRVRDWARYPELRWLNRFDWVPLAALGAGCYGLGEALEAAGIATTGAQLLVWGLFVSTIAVYHATYTINSLAHRWGSRAYDTGDDSRNSPVLALLTLGEGWHNNHHRYPTAARQGFRWWQIDLTYYGLWLLAAIGLIRDLRAVPHRVVAEARR